MKRLVLAGLGALAVVTMMGAANAADLPRRQAMPAKAPVFEAPYNWTGFYVGINGGGGWGHSSWSNSFGTADANLSGGLVGGTIGYNYQMGQAVFGLEGDLDWSNIHGSTNTGICSGGSCETRNSWLATARGRLGYAFDRVMPYVTGGAAFGDIKATPVGPRHHHHDQNRLDPRRRRRVRHRRSVDREDRISLCRSRQGKLRHRHLRDRDRRELPRQRGARGHQLSLLIKTHEQMQKPRSSLRGFCLHASRARPRSWSPRRPALGQRICRARRAGADALHARYRRTADRDSRARRRARSGRRRARA